MRVEGPGGATGAGRDGQAREWRGWERRGGGHPERRVAGEGEPESEREHRPGEGGGGAEEWRGDREGARQPS